MPSLRRTSKFLLDGDGRGQRTGRMTASSEVIGRAAASSAWPLNADWENLVSGREEEGGWLHAKGCIYTRSSARGAAPLWPRSHPTTCHRAVVCADAGASELGEAIGLAAATGHERAFGRSEHQRGGLRGGPPGRWVGVLGGASAQAASLQGRAATVIRHRGGRGPEDWGFWRISTLPTTSEASKTATHCRRPRALSHMQHQPGGTRLASLR